MSLDLGSIGIYEVGPEIGKGSFATVYKCRNPNTNQAVAIKSVVRLTLKLKRLLENLEIEISILKSMKHPHIVGLLDYLQTATYFFLVMDYCSMGDLSYFIRKRGQLIKTHPVISSLMQRYPSPEDSRGLNATLVVHFLQQLSSALQFLRSKSLVHRDIKPQNLLLCPPAHSQQEFDTGNFAGLWELPILKIADFGFARFLPSTSMAETLCGSPLYMAPEILRYEKYTANADLWSVGAVFYEMTVGKPPFRAVNHIELLKNIEKSHDKIKFSSSAHVPESLKSLIRSLLKYNPTERVSFNEFFNDPLIVNKLESNNKPLETSHMDENLFISEYISPIKDSDRANFIQPILSDDKFEEKGASFSKPFDNKDIHRSHVLIPSHTVAPRDEQIMLIITKNSPDPSSSTRFTQPRYMEKRHGPGTNKEDIILEKDYVVVEKRAVEVNAIADELAKVGTRDLGRRRLNASSERDALIARRNSQRSNSSGSQHGLYGDRKISVSISPSNALGKAITLASHRIFGNTTAENTILEDEQVSDGSRQRQEGSSLEFENNLLLNKLNLPISSTIAANAAHGTEVLFSEDEKFLNNLESLATKAHAVNLFADVKFSQLIPSPPSDNTDEDFLQHDDNLPPSIVKTICEEGVVLYVKTLSLLAKGMVIASEWWGLYYEKDDTTDTRQLVKSLNCQSLVKINELVQWIREKFNECLEKAEYIKLRLEEALESISQSNASVSSPPFNESRNMYIGGSGGSGDSGVNAHIVASKVSSEKLIFDRALEISRNAAVNELVKEDLKGCELAYSTAIWMLEALLDEEGAEEERLDAEDKATIERFIVSIGNRLSVLKRKLDLF
ncbi:Pkinase-domain-containing protein [Metschnikowia bicuspidata var. bicuspidata NRRL YB-4993]|uniref:Serine/threonine-protein kinase ATG1 n=1 Tax=Metschnikowia bicuspidata var. bicuspidata NRRL YB-4993 TaxID=869754 RepID=A0A1A0HDD5_9ASCO|nr:Pkinase-domain-containing protein [Metschnikowia bicuspidata var. bicuspidata NRRL YB-4993]OBA21907.1 Pkinase-domain-containing protein [Metschnikowia bicuspidata var. bicuspidata NRRL YB-4993]